MNQEGSLVPVEFLSARAAILEYCFSSTVNN